MIKYSIIVPVYNVEKYLERCINSLINQTYSNIEIILVNDGSSDNSENILKTYSNKYDNIKYINKKNGGQASARNLGLTKVSGDYISFIDSDDYVEENMFEEINKILEEDKKDIIVFDMYQINKQNKIILKGFNNKSTDNNKNYIISPAGPCNKIYSKQIASKIKFLENHIYEDLAVIPSLACYTNNIYYLDKPLYNYVIYGESTMRQNKYNEKLLDIFKVVEHMENEFIKNKKYNEYSEEIEYIYIEDLLHGATLRFIKYEEGLKDIIKIKQIIKEKYPNYYKNKYYKLKNIKYKIMCYLTMHNKIKLLKKLLK